MEKPRVMEMLIALIFIVLVFIMILIGLSASNSKTTSSTISNSYNTINSHNVVQSPQSTAHRDKTTVKVVQKTTYLYKDYDKKAYPKYSKYDKNHYSSKQLNYYDYSPKEKHAWDWGEDHYYKDYDSYGRHIKEDKKGYYADTYKVYVYNDGPGDYITVRFYFEDSLGHEKSHDMRKYVGFDDETLFYFRDVSKYKDEYHNWRYKILD